MYSNLQHASEQLFSDQLVSFSNVSHNATCFSQFWDIYFAVLSQLGQFHFSQVNVRPVILLVLIGTGDCLGELQI